MTTTKTCGTCGDVKPISEFWSASNKRYPDLRRSYCKACAGSRKTEDTTQEKRRRYGPTYCAVCDRVRSREDFGTRDGRVHHPCRECESHRVRRAKFGLSEDEYAALTAVKVCGICGVDKNIAGRDLAIDHDHATGKVRGLLCHNCNAMLGHARDNPEYLLRAVDWLAGM